MTRLMHTLPFLVLLGTGTVLSAQETQDTEGAAAETEATTQTQEADGADDTATQEPAAADTAESADTATEGNAEQELDLGREVQEDPSYIKETYGDWQLQCFRSEAGEDPCQMYQLLREAEGNPVAEFSLFKLPSDGQAVAGATVVVPLGTLLPEGLKIAVDGGKAKSYNYSFCSMGGCFARIGFTEADIAAFQAGAKARIILIPAQAPDQPVGIDASLSGFTAAYNEVSVVPN